MNTQMKNIYSNNPIKLTASNNPIQNPTGKIHDVSLDLIRLIAFILLIACHACDPFNAAATYGSGESNPEFTWWGAVWGSVVRPCVPLFVMLTGALLLQHPLGEHFYRRRIPRVLWPFLIWSVLYYLFPWILDLLGGGADTVTLFFPWTETTSQTLDTAWSRIVRIPFHFSYVACHMWYIYMLIGLYLYLPVFSAWVERATRRQQEVFLGIWGLSTFLPYVTEFVSKYHFGTCDWNQFGLFYSFAGFNGYLLLGHYLHTYVRWSLSRALAIGIPMFAAGYAVNLSGYLHVLSMDQPTPQQIELFWTYCTPNVACMSITLFLWARALPMTNRRICALLAHLTYCGFGIYMIHYFFIGPAFEAVSRLGIPVPLRIGVSAVLVLLISWAVVALGKRILGRGAKVVFG